jgi:alpha-L-fucosidase 2
MEFGQEIAEAGKSTAREHWNARGWVLHQNTDLWRSTTPMDGPSWGAWPVGGAWIMTNLYEHFRFSQDEAYLKKLYPLLKGQVEFLLDILVQHPEKGWLVTAPSNSPENFPAWPGNGRFFDEVSGLYLKARTMAVGPTMDMQIIREVFAIFAEASSKLNRDDDLARQATDAANRLAPNQIGKHGQLQEWIEDYDEIEPEHRHLSHLWGLYPGSEITPELSPREASASGTSIDRRGTGGCGWSYGWKIGLWARLYNPVGALHEFRSLLTESSLPNMFSLCGRTLQVDGNFGATSSIAEMLLQSHQTFVHLLPALPDEWATGSVTGMRARGNLEFSMDWADGRLFQATVKAGKDGSIRIKADGLKEVIYSEGSVQLTSLNDEILRFDAENGVVYTLKF